METNETIKALRKEAAANPCAGLCSACDIAECMTRLQIQAADRIEEQDAEIKALRDKMPECVACTRGQNWEWDEGAEMR